MKTPSVPSFPIDPRAICPGKLNWDRHSFVIEQDEKVPHLSKQETQTFSIKYRCDTEEHNLCCKTLPKQLKRKAEIIQLVWESHSFNKSNSDFHCELEENLIKYLDL